MMERKHCNFIKEYRSIQSILIITLLGITMAGLYGQKKPADPLKPVISNLPAANPSEVGMRMDTISHLLELIRQTNHPDFRGLIVFKNNKLVVEEYFNTFWRATIEDIRSAGKSITGILAGIAIDQGLISSVDQRLDAFFPAFSNHKGQPIRIRDLLAMSSGLDADDNNNNSPGNFTNWVLEDDWIQFAQTLPEVFPPGSRYVYNDVCPMLIGEIIQKASGMTLATFAEKYLFAPLGIEEYYWYSAPNGHTVPMGNLYLSTLDFAKIGLLLLNEGMWMGSRVVNQQWIQQLSKPRFDLSSIDPFAQGYGNFWFTGTKVWKGKSIPYYYASGNGGNLLFIVPEFQMVVALTSTAYGQGYGHFRGHRIFETILHAIN